MPKATICVDVGVLDQAAGAAWLERWRTRLPFVSESEGCGCCLDLYRVEAPREALDGLPPQMFAASEWSGIESA